MMKYIPILAFWSLGIIWGSNFIYMKMAAEFIEPMQVVFYRVLFGFIPVFFYALYIKALKFEDLKYIIHFVVMSLLAAVIYFFGYVKGSSLLLSGIAGALSGAIPLFSFLMASIFLKEEKVTKLALLGVLLGFLGVLIISGVFSSNLENTNIEGVLYLLIASLSVGSSFVYAKKFIMPLKINVVALTTYQLGSALIILFLIVDFKGINNIWQDTHSFIGLVVGLGILGTGLAYILYYYMIEKLGVLKASSITYIPPVVALIIGFFIVGEDIKMIDFIATIFIFFGVFLINKKDK
ncbi:DMT family transporter [Poseidonibacter antarcticus]|uniref:DMT family transporter n=1 Tax=Poseidonibacter antarcticus TaxID=2478538 RepID=UPI001D195F5B|nr:DMT family transporter [Poseidonibacter antarcticus]